MRHKHATAQLPAAGHLVNGSGLGRSAEPCSWGIPRHSVVALTCFLLECLGTASFVVSEEKLDFLPAQIRGSFFPQYQLWQNLNVRLWKALSVIRAAQDATPAKLAVWDFLSYQVRR